MIGVVNVVLVAAVAFYMGGAVAIALVEYPEVRDDPFSETTTLATAVVCAIIGLSWPGVVYGSVSGWAS